MDKKKILVVEDEKAISDILVFNLQREGYDTLAAYDGAEGLRCALEEAPDLILLDVMLPEMDGFEVCRRVRAEKDTPIVRKRPTRSWVSSWVQTIISPSRSPCVS